MRRYRYIFFILSGIVVISIAGCSPSLSPLFRDYEIDNPVDTVEERIRRALEADDWELAETNIPNVVKTTDRVLNRRLIYKTVISLEVVPIEGEYVRVFIHPYRDNLIGGKSKIPYLPANIRRQVIPSITQAFEEEGLYTIGSSRRDTSVAAN